MKCAYSVSRGLSGEIATHTHTDMYATPKLFFAPGGILLLLLPVCLLFAFHSLHAPFVDSLIDSEMCSNDSAKQIAILQRTRACVCGVVCVRREHLHLRALDERAIRYKAFSY